MIRHLALAALVALGACSPSSSDTTPPATALPVILNVHDRLDAAHDAERLLIFSAPERNADLELMRDRIAMRALEVEERDITVAWLVGPADGRFGEQELSVEAVEELRLVMDLDSAHFGGVLVGKDGGVKERYARATDLNVIFALIDLMPMRQAEMDDR